MAGNGTNRTRGPKLLLGAYHKKMGFGNHEYHFFMGTKSELVPQIGDKHLVATTEIPSAARTPLAKLYRKRAEKLGFLYYCNTENGNPRERIYVSTQHLPTSFFGDALDEIRVPKEKEKVKLALELMTLEHLKSLGATQVHTNQIPESTRDYQWAVPLDIQVFLPTRIDKLIRAIRVHLGIPVETRANVVNIRQYQH